MWQWRYPHAPKGSNVNGPISFLRAFGFWGVKLALNSNPPIRRKSLLKVIGRLSEYDDGSWAAGYSDEASRV